MTPQEINEKFARLAGICEHEHDKDTIEPQGWKYPVNSFPCLQTHIAESHPDFCADPRLVLREMSKKGDYLWFFSSITPIMHLRGMLNWVDDYILDTTGKLALKASEWMEKDKK
jgi:hypothetical protein